MISHGMLFSLIVAAIIGFVYSATGWTYHKIESNPSNWAKLFPAMCDGYAQSPINLDTSEAVYDKYLKTISIKKSSNFSEAIILKNNGHSISLMPWINSYKFCFTSLDCDYRIHEIHFHWGKNDLQGSEHTINGEKYPLEMHIVSFNQKMFKTIGEAVKSPYGLAVFGYLFEITKDGNTQFEMLDYLENKFQTISREGDINIDLLRPLLDTNRDNYFRYLGSLTTPPCTQNVIWTVFRDRLSVNENTLQLMRHFQFITGDTGSIMDNFRPVQLLNPPQTPVRRLLTRSWKVESDNKGSALSYGCMTILLIFGCIFM